jgi:hypothetical protein
MKTFRINEHIEIVCVSERTRSGFRHVATLIVDGNEIDTNKVCYQNRTWERYDFESVMVRLVRKTPFLSDADKKLCNEYLAGDRTDWSAFRTISSIAKMGDLLCDNERDKNNWKARMLKAGIPDLDIPKEWDNLDEAEKSKRLDAVIAMTTKLGDKH